MKPGAVSGYFDVSSPDMVTFSMEPGAKMGSRNMSTPWSSEVYSMTPISAIFAASSAQASTLMPWTFASCSM